MVAKVNNNRRYPEANHQPKHIAHLRVKEAKERQEAYNQLPVSEKIAKLDLKLGKDVGAKKQREKLQKQLDKA